MADFLFIAVARRKGAPASLIMIRSAVNSFYAFQEAERYAADNLTGPHAVHEVENLYDPGRYTRCEQAPPDRIGELLAR